MHYFEFAFFVCIPYQNLFSLTASTDGRYSFGNVSRSGIANSSFAISKVTYKDRSKYYCVAMFPSGKPVTQEFILRVRGILYI